MSEIILELSLVRSSGVLAGIVAALAQTGLELKSQKLERANGGWLTVHATGEPPEPSALAERMAATRGVERLMRMEIDGDLILAEGRPIAGQIETADLAELSSGLDARAVDTDVEASGHDDPFRAGLDAKASHTGQWDEDAEAGPERRAEQPATPQDSDKPESATDRTADAQPNARADIETARPAIADNDSATEACEGLDADNGAGGLASDFEAASGGQRISVGARVERGEEGMKMALRRRRRRRR